MDTLQGPKYQQVVHWLSENINNGTYRQGEKLPSEHELSERFELSRQTIRHAIDILVQQGKVRRIRGSGTYVNRSGRVVRQERHMNIAVISTYIDIYIFPGVMRGLEAVLSQNGYTMQMAFTGNLVEQERDILQKILEKRNIDGLIVEPAKSALPNPNLHYYHELIGQGIPVLFFNSHYPALDLPYVSLNDEMAGQRAAEYLIRSGHQRIAGIFKCDDGQGHLRYAGYTKAMREAGLISDGKRVIWIDTVDQKRMSDWADYLLQRLSEYTAVVCYNDEVAYILANICQAKGVRIPEQLSIIGIDNSDLCSMGDIPITSFRHPVKELGEKTAQNMMNLIENPHFDGNYLFDAELVERSSVIQR
ncbi:MAG: GntR family transcriptional regulator [Lachnospiraceae bacterium]